MNGQFGFAFHFARWSPPCRLRLTFACDWGPVVVEGYVEGPEPPVKSVFSAEDIAPHSESTFRFGIATYVIAPLVFACGFFGAIASGFAGDGVCFLLSIALLGLAGVLERLVQVHKTLCDAAVIVIGEQRASNKIARNTPSPLPVVAVKSPSKPVAKPSAQTTMGE